MKRSKTGIGEAALVLLLLGLRAVSAANIEEIKVTALVGGVAELPCDISPGSLEVSGSNRSSVLLVVWYKDDTPVYSWDARAPAGAAPSQGGAPPGAHWAAPPLAGRARWADRPSRLGLRPARPKDGGLYRCRADFRTEPSKFTHVRLIIVEPPATPRIFDEDGREVLGKAGPYREGDMPVFFCVVTGGNPQPTIRWFRDDDPVPPSGLAGGDEFTDYAPRHRGKALTPIGLPVRLPALHRSDILRKFSCRANNSHLLPTVTATIVIDMQLAPVSVEIEAREPLRAGRTEIVVCRAKGARPPARLHWLLQGTPLPPHAYKQEESTSEDVSISQLELAVGREQRGQQLTCRATHMLLPPSDPLYSIMTLDILLPPDVSLRLGREVNIDNIKEGDAVLFECNVLAHPPPYKISWEHNGRTIAHEPTAGVEVDWGRLTLPSVQADDSGSYSCMASNVEGDTKSNTINLQVLYPPVCKINEETKRLTILHGKKEVELLCEVFANPPPTNFTWALNTSSGLVNLPQEQFSWSDMNSKLRYLPLGSNGKIVEGEALCWASNRLGRQEAPCSLKLVSPPPPAPKNCALHNLTAFDFSLLCDTGNTDGLSKMYELTVQLSSNGELLANLTTNQPVFRVGGLPGGKELRLLLYAVGTHKRSTPVELFIIMPHPPKTYKGSYSSLQTVLLFGITLGTIALFSTAVILIKFKNKFFKQFHGDYKSSRQAATGLREEECSTVVHEDRNPDVVPLNKVEQNGIAQMRAEEEWEVAARSPRLAQDSSPKTETAIPEAVGTWSIRALHGREVVTSCTPLPLTQESCV